MDTRSAPRIGPAASGVSEVELDGQICVYSPEGEQVLALNGTASDVWRLSDGAHTLDEVIQLLSTAYAVDAAAIADDVSQVIERFREARLLADDPRA